MADQCTAALRLAKKRARAAFLFGWKADEDQPCLSFKPNQSRWLNHSQLRGVDVSTNSWIGDCSTGQTPLTAWIWQEQSRQRGRRWVSWLPGRLSQRNEEQSEPTYHRRTPAIFDFLWRFRFRRLREDQMTKEHRRIREGITPLGLGLIRRKIYELRKKVDEAGVRLRTLPRETPGGQTQTGAVSGQPPSSPCS